MSKNVYYLTSIFLLRGGEEAPELFQPMYVRNNIFLWKLSLFIQRFVESQFFFNLFIVKIFIYGAITLNVILILTFLLKFNISFFSSILYLHLASYIRLFFSFNALFQYKHRQFKIKYSTRSFSGKLANIQEIARKEIKK